MKDHSLNLSRWISNQVMMIIFLLTSSSYYADAQLIGGSSHDFYRTWDMTMAALLVAMVFAFYLIGIFFIFIRCCSESAHFTEASHTPTHHHHHHPAFLASPGRLPQLHRQQQQEPQHQHGLDPEAIDAFPLFQYSEVKNVKIGREVTLECAVCLSEFEDDEALRLMPKCNHVFHHQCVDTWLATHVTCPVCRANLSPDTDLTRTAPQHTAAAANDNLSPADQSNAVMLQSDQVVAVNVDEERKTRDSEVQQYRTEMSGLSGYFRSHSTGHAMGLLGDSTERFTLRLPEKISINEIAENSELRRTMSFNVVLAREGSSEKGEGSSGGKASDWSDWWGNVCRRGSVKQLKGDNCHAESSNDARNRTFLPLTSPLDGKGNPQGSIRPSV